MSSVLDNRQANTCRLYQSMIATRYMNPFLIGTYVMSLHQTWLARSIVRPRSRYGYTLWPGAGIVVLRG